MRKKAYTARAPARVKPVMRPVMRPTASAAVPIGSSSVDKGPKNTRRMATLREETACKLVSIGTAGFLVETFWVYYMQKCTHPTAAAALWSKP